MRKILTIAAIVLSICAVLLGIYTWTASQTDEELNALIDRSVVLAEARLDQAEEFFFENRQKFELLGRAEELQARNVTFISNMMISVADDEIWWASQWGQLPWMTPEIGNAVLELLHTDTPGALDLSIVYNNNTMHFTLFATPLHAVLHNQQQQAWVMINYGEASPPWENRHVVHTQPIEDGFYLTITALQHRNEAFRFLLITILFVVLAIASFVVLIWGIKTYKFAPESDNTLRTIFLIVAAIVVLTILSWLSMRGLL